LGKKGTALPIHYTTLEGMNMYNRIGPQAEYKFRCAKHQVYTRCGKVIEVMADGKKEARKIVESHGYAVAFVTRIPA